MHRTPTLLFIAANPATTARLALDEEVRLIEQELRLSAPPGTLRVRALWAARPIEVLRAIQRERPAIVHFAGHADPAGLVLAGDPDGHVAVSGLQLSQLLAGMSEVTRLIVLNACLSDAQSGALVTAVGCAITLQTPIGDVDARRFSQALYAALAQGQPVRRAFDQAAALLEIHRPCLRDARDVVGVHADDLRIGGRLILRTRPDVDAHRLCLVSADSVDEPTDRRWRWKVALGVGLAALLWILALAMVSSSGDLRISAEVSRGPSDSHSDPSPALIHSSDPECNLIRINELSTRTEGLTVVIDVTLQNIGQRTANVTRIGLDDPTRPHRKHATKQATAEYSLRLSQDPDDLIVSHVLPPDEVDRIIVRVHPTPAYAGKRVTAGLRVKYNRTCWTDPEPLEFICPGKP